MGWMKVIRYLQKILYGLLREKMKAPFFVQNQRLLTVPNCFSIPGATWWVQNNAVREPEVLLAPGDFLAS